jgi:MFS family permease
MAGLIFGWASLSSTVLVSSRDDGGAELSRNYVHVMFVCASFFNFLGPLLLGIVLDKYGPRVCSVLSILLVAIGFFLFAMSDVDSMPFFIPAICLIAFGGPGCQNAIIHLSNLFPKWKASATAVITGSFQLSFSVFYFFNILFKQSHVSYQTLFFGYSIVCLLNGLVSMFFWPDEPYSFEEQCHELVSNEAEIVRQSRPCPHPPLTMPL